MLVNDGKSIYKGDQSKKEVVALLKDGAWHMVKNKYFFEKATEEEIEYLKTASTEKTIYLLNDCYEYVNDALNMEPEKAVKYLSETDSESNTRLMLIAYGHHNERHLMALLQNTIPYGLDLNKTNRVGNTAYFFACQNNNFQNAITLFEAGANVTMKNSKGKYGHELMDKKFTNEVNALQAAFNSQVASVNLTSSTRKTSKNTI